MELDLDERKLLADFRRLPEAARQEVIDYVAFLGKKHDGGRAGEDRPAAGRCAVKYGEERPEAVREPLFTE